MIGGSNNQSIPQIFYIERKLGSHIKFSEPTVATYASSSYGKARR